MNYIPSTLCETVDLSEIRDFPRNWSDLRLSHPRTIRCRSGQIGCLDDNRMHYYIKPPLLGNVISHDFVFRTNPFRSFEETIVILVTFDPGYVDIAKTWMSSLSQHNSHALCRVVCHTRNVSDERFREIRLHVRQFANIVLFHKPATKDYNSYTSPLTHVNACCMDRLFVTELDYGMETNRIIYLDLDILIIGSLSPLMHIDTNSTGIAAKSSKVKNVINGWLRKYNINDLKYVYGKSFNAGVMVIDIDKLKANDYWKRVMSMFDKYPVNDQILLNFYARGAYAELPAKYNVFVGQDNNLFSLSPCITDSAVVLHFVGTPKPWKHTVDTYPNNTDLWKLWKEHQNHQTSLVPVFRAR